MDRTPAILLRKTKLTESSLILTWFTQEHGKLKTVAKGARQAKSRFAGVVDLFFECEIQYVRSRHGELHSLQEAALLDPHEALRFDHLRVMAAGYFAELLDLVTEPEHGAPDLFDLLQRALRFLSAQPASRRAVVHFESELVRLLGITEPGTAPLQSLARAGHAAPALRGVLWKELTAREDGSGR